MKFERNGRTWHWPDEDQKLIQVFDWIQDVDYIMQFVDDTSTCIQAGGAMGQWPVEFAKYFNTVVTFEPHPANFEYLLRNTDDLREIIIPLPYALDSDARFVSMHLDDCEDGNSGAYYAQIGGDIKSVAIDDLKVGACGLIQLDVEGYEYYALSGGIETIYKYFPVIVIEEKPLPHLKEYEHLKARQLLESIGYKEVGSIHRDVVFKK